MKNVIKRCGIVFILGPIFIIFLTLNILIFFTIIVWGPIYYIITGNDPFSIESFLFAFDRLFNWYLEKFGPDE